MGHTDKLTGVLDSEGAINTSNNQNDKMMMMMFHRHTAWVTLRSWWRYSTQRALSTPPPTSNNQTDKMMMIMMFYRHTLWDTRTS